MRIAAIDIGTNSARLLIADTHPTARSEVDRITTVTSLGGNAGPDGELARTSIDRTADTLSRYRRRVAESEIDVIVAVATAAARRAPNRDEFLEAATEALGSEPRVITGTDEAHLAFVGSSSIAADPATALVIDIGGGSTEFVTERRGHSVEIGSVRLTETMSPDRPVGFDHLIETAAAAARVLEPVALRADSRELIGVAGTWTSLAAIALDLPAYDRAAVHRSVTFRIDIDRLVVGLAARTIAETAAIPSLDPARAPVLLGGAIVARECLRHLGAEAITISELDLLDGIVDHVSRGQTIGSCDCMSHEAD